MPLGPYLLLNRADDGSGPDLYQRYIIIGEMKALLDHQYHIADILQRVDRFPLLRAVTRF